MKKTILGLSALVIGAGIVFASVSNVGAYRGDPTIKGPNYTAERHEAMEKAFDSKDFSAWSKLLQLKGRVTQIINKDNFAKFAEAHKLAEAGKFVEANKIRTELGLNQFNRSGKGMGMRNGR